MNKTSSFWITQINNQNINRNCNLHIITFYNINNWSNLILRYLGNSNIHLNTKLNNNSNNYWFNSKQWCNNSNFDIVSFSLSENISYMSTQIGIKQSYLYNNEIIRRI